MAAHSWLQLLFLQRGWHSLHDAGSLRCIMSPSIHFLPLKSLWLRKYYYLSACLPASPFWFKGIHHLKICSCSVWPCMVFFASGSEPWCFKPAWMHFVQPLANTKAAGLWRAGEHMHLKIFKK